MKEWQSQCLIIFNTHSHTCPPQAVSNFLFSFDSCEFDVDKTCETYEDSKWNIIAFNDSGMRLVINYYKLWWCSINTSATCTMYRER